MRPGKIPEDAKEIEEGLSNKVYFHEDSVYKFYRFLPLPGLYASFLELFRGRIIFFSRKRRMRNEIKMTGLIEKAGLETPEIRKVTDKIIVFEKINGSSGFKYLSESNGKQAQKFGRTLREFMEQLHEMDVALKDARLSNFLIEENGDINSIDHEYASLEAGKFFKLLDELTLISSARQTSKYHEFREGFRPHRYAAFISIFTAFYHILLFNRDRKRLENLWNSLRPRKRS